MAAEKGASTSPPQRPGFFKFVFPHPSNKLGIPKKFHAHFPSKLPKMATLLCPHAEYWDIEICQTGQDIFFQRGWSEFSKAHDLHTGYLLLFRYTGVMNFVVEVFDTFCCHKDYPLKRCTRSVYPFNEVEVSSGSKDPSLSDESDSDQVRSVNGKLSQVSNEEKRLTSQQNTLRGSNCKKLKCIDINDLTESDSRVSDAEIPGNFFGKRKNFSNLKEEDDDAEEEINKNSPRKKILKIDPNSTCFDQFEKIVTHTAEKSSWINIPRAFCVKNHLVKNSTIFLKRKLEEGKVITGKWPVKLYFGPSYCRIREGWRNIAKENSLKAGNRCIFQLISKDTFLVQTMAPDCLSTEGKKELGSQGVNSPPIASMKEIITCNRENQMDNTQCERVIKKYNLTAYMSLPELFCKANGLVREQTIYLKRSINGKTWFVHYHCYPRKHEGRLYAGWRAFASENGLEEGDLCTFQLLSENTFQVNIVQKCQKENILVAFCRINKFTSNRPIIVMKAPDMKVWCVKFYFSKFKGSRFQGEGWRKFVTENELKDGEECFLIKLVDKKTVLLQVVKS